MTMHGKTFIVAFVAMLSAGNLGTTQGGAKWFVSGDPRRCAP